MESLASSRRLPAADVLHLRPASWSHYAGYALVGVFLLFAAAHVAARGPVDWRGNFNLCDFANHYASARMWLIGQNPYDRDLLPVAWQASGAGAFHTQMDEWYGLLPPGAHVLLAPIAAMPPGVATAVWMILSIASIAVSIGCVLSLAQIRPTSLNGMLLISAALAAAPFQTLLAVGQASLPTIAMILLAVWCAHRRHDAWAGLLLGAAAALKPQLAAPFGLFYLLYRNWTLVGFAAAAGIALNVIGIAQMEWRGQPWLSGWMNNIALSTSPGSANDPSLDAPLRHQIISLSVLVRSCTGIRSLQVGLNVLGSVALVGAYVWLTGRGRLSADSLLSVAVLGAVSLLPVYHRSYDAAILLPALAWALVSLHGGLRLHAWIVLGALSILMLPFDLLPLLERKAGLFAGISSTWAWQALVAPHHAWAALTVCVALLVALHAKIKPFAAAEPADDDPDVIRLDLAQRAADTALRWRIAREEERVRRTG